MLQTVRRFTPSRRNYSIRRLDSKLDASVNWITKYGKDHIETRYVRKTDDYFICYVSSHTGCKMGCTFCHLTQQGQTSFDHITPELYGNQVRTVLTHYKNLLIRAEPKARRMNVNFMARGEPFANKYVVNEWNRVHDEIVQPILAAGLTPKLNVSTILPHAIRHRNLADIFGEQPAHVYYSMYTTDSLFRRVSIPGAIDVYEALDKLKEYEIAVGDKIPYPVTFHWALIEGQNDSIEAARETARVLKRYDFKSKFNLVRYNPHPNTGTKESARIQEIFDIISDAIGGTRSYIVPRVGPDVKASCGMFIEE